MVWVRPLLGLSNVLNFPTTTGNCQYIHAGVCAGRAGGRGVPPLPTRHFQLTIMEELVAKKTTKCSIWDYFGFNRAEPTS